MDFVIDIESKYDDDGRKIKVEVTVGVVDIPMIYDLDPNDPGPDVTGGILYAAWKALLRGEKIDRD